MGTGRLSADELAEHVRPDQVRTFTATKGTIIFCNTSGLHRGGFVEAKPRVLATATYCSPASLRALSRRNFVPSPEALGGLSPQARFAVS